MDEAARADRVIVLDEGKVKFDDTPQKVFECEEELVQMGLDVPQSCALSHRLRKMGIPMKEGILTVQECAKEILRIAETADAKGKLV